MMGYPWDWDKPLASFYENLFRNIPGHSKNSIVVQGVGFSDALRLAPEAESRVTVRIRGSWLQCLSDPALAVPGPVLRA